MIRGVLLDLSGVLYNGDVPVSGAMDAMQKLSDTGLPVRYITNTTRNTRQTILNRLTRMGFNINLEDVFTAPVAAKDYLKNNNYDPFLLIHPNLEPEFADIKQVKNINAVLVGDAAEGFNYQNMNNAFRILLNGAELLAMGVNRYFKDGDQFSLDAGPFVHALENASGKQAIIIGKPAREFYMSAVKSLGCTPGETVMVGDDVESDVIGAVESGLIGILVKTGKYMEGDERKIKNTAKCVTDISAAIDYILEQT
jgi:HAD superfamily hydrolase (TIGR01458 family)